MRILFACKSMILENLGVMYLSAVAKKAGHIARIVEFRDAAAIANRWKPEIIGYSVMTGDQQLVKEINAKINTSESYQPIRIVGGPHPTFFPEDFQPLSSFNIVYQGEAEQAFAELLCMPGFAATDYNNIDSLPWPDRDDFPDREIRDFITSRGCPFNCSYCYNERWAKMFPEYPRVRTRSVDDVIKEIENVSPEFVYFQDSCFGLDHKWFRDFSTKYRNKINAPYHCHMRPNQVTEEQVYLLHDSNCMSVRIALESASSRLRDLMNRTNTDLNKVLRAVTLLKRWNIRLMIQNIIGLPTSAIEEDLETLEFNIRCKPDYGWVSIFTPYPGTELGDRCHKEGWYTGDYSDIMDNFFDTSPLNFTPEHREQLECLQKIFALCVEVGYLPNVAELTHHNLAKLVHKIMRRHGDNRLYGGVI